MDLWKVKSSGRIKHCEVSLIQTVSLHTRGGKGKSWQYKKKKTLLPGLEGRKVSDQAYIAQIDLSSISDK